jgi:hypothetical protein
MLMNSNIGGHYPATSCQSRWTARRHFRPGGKCFRFPADTTVA